jgi:orotidine-5'-phosphate decarboxylase
VIVALDLSDIDQARRMVAMLGDEVSFYKIGMQLVFAGGLVIIDELTATGKRVFLDMKLLDIDNTISGAVESIARLGVTLMTIHAYPKAMRAAVGAARWNASEGREPGLGLLAVTVLTSMDDADLAGAGYAEDAPRLVARRAADALAAGMDGIVCSAQETEAVRSIVGSKMTIVTPGIRPADAVAGDQKRTMRPSEAIAAGADFLVVGRPITAADDPAAAARRIVAEVEGAL